MNATGLAIQDMTAQNEREAERAMGAIGAVDVKFPGR